MNKSIEHNLSDGILHIEQMDNYEKEANNNLIKFIYLHSSSQNRYEIILNNNDVNNLCPLFIVCENLCWKVFNSKPVVLLKVSTVSLQWKISVSFEEVRIVSVNLDLMTGEDQARINRQFQVIAEENKLLKDKVESMQKEQARMKEVLLRLTCMNLSYSHHPSYYPGYISSSLPYFGLTNQNVSDYPNNLYDKFKHLILP